MEEQVISFDTAKLAKEKGFDKFKGQVQGFYVCSKTPIIEENCVLNKLLINNSSLAWSMLAAPTQSLLQKWLREEHGIHMVIQYSKYWKGYQWRYDDWRGREHNPNTKRSPYPKCKTYEKAMEEGLKEALKLIKQ